MTLQGEGNRAIRKPRNGGHQSDAGHKYSLIVIAKVEVWLLSRKDE